MQIKDEMFCDICHKKTFIMSKTGLCPTCTITLKKENYSIKKSSREQKEKEQITTLGIKQCSKIIDDVKEAK